MTVFRATYSDWKLIRSRKVVQVVLELPIEVSGHAYDVLGGMPNPASEVWVGVARLKDGSPKEVMPDTVSGTGGRNDRPHNIPPASADKPARAHRSWHEMTPAQQAGLLCGDANFQHFIADKIGGLNPRFQISEAVAQRIREICRVKSRADILPDTDAADKWRSLVSDYRVWSRLPEYVG